MLSCGNTAGTVISSLHAGAFKDAQTSEISELAADQKPFSFEKLKTKRNKITQSAPTQPLYIVCLLD